MSEVPVPPPPAPAADPTPPVPPPPTTPDGRQVGEHVGPVTAFWARSPLRIRLVAIVTLVLLAGLGSAVVLTNTLLSQFLVQQVDDQLRSTATQFADQALSRPQDVETPTQTLPSDYFIVLFRDDGGAPEPRYQEAVARQYGVPKLGAYTFTDETRPSGPFTVGAVDMYNTGITPRSEWRVIALVGKSGDDPIGIVYVGLPLHAVHETAAQVQRLLIFSALLITAIGAIVGYVAVRRSLRSLGVIERTAAAIADGDLSRRIPQAPPTTEVGSLAHSLNVMLSQIEQAFAAREASEVRMRRFVSDASHELRTPLAAVRGYGELYRMGALTTPEALSDTMRRIEDSATRMGSLVEDLLHLARLDEGRAIAREPVDLAVLAADAMSDLHALDPTRSVRLVPLTEGGTTGSVVVIGDDDRLRQVLANLVGNAARHTPAGSPVEVALGYLEEDGARTGVLELRDHGPGIPAEHAERVFERFFRVDSSRNRTSGGSGLGLAIVAAITGTLGGRASVRETPGGGLTVRVTLPAA